MQPLTLRFADPGLEQGFKADWFEKNRRFVRFGVLLAIICIVLCAVMIEVYVLPTLSPALQVYTRVQIYVFDFGCLGGFLVLSGTRWYARFWQFGLALICFILSVGILPSLVLLPLVLVRMYAHAMFICMTIAIAAVSRLRFVYALSITVLLATGYMVCMLIREHFLVQDLLSHGLLIWAAAIAGLFASWQIERYARKTFLEHQLLEEERRRSEDLLLNILPPSIAARLKTGTRSIADRFPEATVLFADVAGFTVLSAKLDPQELVDFLNQVFSKFDHIAEKFKLEKIKTIGDAYMVAAGVPEPREDNAEAVVKMALEMVETVAALKTPTGDQLQMRIGIHTGPVVAGVIGVKKFAYDLWGDTVNTASRMESHGLAGAIQVTEGTYAKLGGKYDFVDRGVIEVKGKGEMRTWLLTP